MRAEESPAQLAAGGAPHNTETASTGPSIPTARPGDTLPDPVLAAALDCAAAGLSVVPIGAGKTPPMAWKGYQDTRATAEQIHRWFAPGHRYGLGLVTGPVSGNLEMAELEQNAMSGITRIREYAEAVGQLDLWTKATTGWLEQSPSGGLHYLYRTDDTPAGNTKLARRPATPEELAANPSDRIKVLTETRGTGGLTVLAPTPGTLHPSRKPWNRLLGGPTTMPTLTAGEVQGFHRMLSILDEMPAPAARQAAPQGATPFSAAPSRQSSGAFDGVSPLDDFEARTPWADILEGWTLIYTAGDGTSYWRRPGKPTGQASATTGRSGERDRLFVFSTSTDFPDLEPITKPHAYAILHHGGDDSAAASALRRQGYGQSPHAPGATTPPQAPAPTPAGNQTAPTTDRTATDTAATPDTRHRGQVRIAYRVQDAYAGRLLHVHGIGWHHWDGKRWAEDTGGYAKRAVMDTLRQALADSLGDADLRTDVRKCESAAGLAGVLDIAAALEPFAATVADLDADPWLLNVANGTLDLRTMELQDHNPQDRITKVTQAAYRADTAGPTWDAFLARVLPDNDIRAYLQSYVGVGLAGKVLEHKLAIATGSGRNGKGVFYQALGAALGDYAAVAEPDLFMHRDNAHPTGEMDLRGRRWIVVSESDEGRKLAEATVKRLTGGDKLKARRMRQDFVEFVPSHTALLVTNHLPRVSGDDAAIWARLRVVPFDVVIPPEEQDPRLPEHLELELDAVLSWAITGWRRYQDNGGLTEPAAVTNATDHYRADNDALGRFIEECCDTGPGYTGFTEALHRAWTDWAALDGAKPLSARALGQALEARGYTARKGTGGVRVRQGIQVKIGPADSRQSGIFDRP
ncbi:hypothetical protein D6T63_05650 [Arthrobacter cheniae]|uniref:SF3 helicase domain-containing protein n=1 Tax=Arthrobacter cheniae TaxID=1258888 RepID=A0A3A5MER6_9MICC|nr:phage/plasmid primase, P4 family [Arthrobacter cheniae]RJT82205.1 hypothetical protein D6T63_05650 [Arthrobacter cheniae]